MIIKVLKPRFRKKAIFVDYDWTIVKPKNNATFPKDIDDWEWLRPNVPEVIKAYYARGYAVYIVTNQSKEWKVKHIEIVMAELHIPLTICVARDKAEYKPSPFLYNEALSDDQRQKLDTHKSFFCGDALGRNGDHSDSDLKFAEAIGLKCKSPEDLFPFEQKKKTVVEVKSTQEVIIMVGYAGSGKTFLSNTIFAPAGYVVMHGDDLKTSAKMIKMATPHITDGKSIVFDATNASKKKRSEYIAFAKKHNAPVRCVYVSTSMDESMARNKEREHPVPRIVYSVYNKNFEMPTTDEGCEVVVV